MFCARKIISCIVLLLISSWSMSQKLQSGPQVLTFFSDVDDTEQPYGLYLPKNYDEKKMYPLVIMLHGAGSNHRLSLRRVFGKSNINGETDVEATRYFPEWPDVEYIVASPYARGTMGYQGIPEKDVYDVLADVKKRFSIDEDRVYLTGLSMGGGGTLWIGLTRPDIWAGLFPVCPAPPKGMEDLAPNIFNVPIYFHHGDKDTAVPVSVSRDWTKRLRDLDVDVSYVEYVDVKHNSWEYAYKDGAAFEWFSKFERNKFPDRVLFNSKNYKYNGAYWVQFDKLTPGVLASIDAKFTGPNQLGIKTTALEGFTLHLKNHPLFKAGEQISLAINESKAIKVMDSSGSFSFILQDGKWVDGKYSAPAGSKKIGTEGPISAAFASRHLYIYGTSGNPSEAELKSRMEIATEAANWSFYRNAFLGRVMVFPRVVADKEVRQSDFESSNLILFGTKETNTIIEKYSDRLPMQLKAPSSDYGLLYIFPVDGHYVVVNSGLPWWTDSSAQGRFLPVSLSSLNDVNDFILFKGNTSTIIAAGYFDQNWKMPQPEAKKAAENGVIIKRN